MATVTDRIGAASTTNAATYTTGAFTPALNDLLVLMVGVTGQTATDWVVTDSLGGTWTKIRRQVKATSADIMELWVRNSLVPASSMTITYSHATGNASGIMARCYGIGGVTRTGASAIRQSSGQDNQAAAGTPAPVFGVAVQTTNVVIGTIHNATNPATVTPPASYTELPTPDTGYATPTTGQECVHRNSGETGTTITWGGTSASAFSSLVAEIDTSENLSAFVVADDTFFVEGPDPFWFFTHDAVHDLAWLYPPVAADPIEVTLASDGASIGALDLEAFWPEPDHIAEQGSIVSTTHHAWVTSMAIFEVAVVETFGGTPGAPTGGTGFTGSLGTPTYTNEFFMGASSGARLATQGGGVFYETFDNWWVSGGGTRKSRTFVSFCFAWSQVSVDVPFYWYGNDGGPYVSRLADGRLRILNSDGTTAFTGALVVPADQMVRVEVEMEPDSATLSHNVIVKVYLDPTSSTPDEVLQVRATVLLAQVTTEGPRIGQFDVTVAPVPSAVYLDEVRASVISMPAPSGLSLGTGYRPSVTVNHHRFWEPPLFEAEAWDPTEYQPLHDGSVEAYFNQVATDDSYIASLDLPHDDIEGLYPLDLSDYQPAYDDVPHTLYNDGPLAADEVHAAQPLMWPDHEVYFPEWDYTLDQDQRDGAAEMLLNDGPLAADEVHAAQPLMWPDLEVSFPPHDPDNDQPYSDGAAEILLSDGPLFPDDLVPTLALPDDQAWIDPPYDYTEDQPLVDTALEALLSDGPLFPDDLLATLDIDWGQAPFPDWDYTEDQPIVDGAIEAFIAGPSLFITDELIATLTDSVSSDLEALFPPWDYTNDQPYSDGATEVLLNDGPLFPDDLVPTLYDQQVPDFAEAVMPELVPDTVAEFLALARLEDIFAAFDLLDVAVDFTQPDLAMEFYGFFGGNEHLFAVEPPPPGSSAGVPYDPSIDQRRKLRREHVGAFAGRTVRRN